nr:fer-1-like protein 4 isoform X3 [Macaca fascicularis]
MALTVCVQRLTGLSGTHDRQVKLTFRGFTQKTRKIRCGQEADIGELFRWPHYGAPLAGECLSVQVVNCSRVFSPRPLGTLVISLQQLQNTGHLVLQEALVDENLRVSPIQVELDLKYQPPEGATGAWSEEDFGAPIQDSLELIIPNVGFQELEPGEAQLERRAVALGRRLARSLGQQNDEENELELELEQDLDDEPDVELSGVVFSPLKSRARALAHGDPFQVSRAQDFQVRVTVLEAQKLVGVNINPYVAVQVGGQRRVTATQRGTNCPFYNEYFLFEFHDTRLRLQDLLLEITAFHSQTLPFMATRIGTFRMDLGIVVDQPDGQFYQRWAPLHDPRDTRAGTKGFVKVTLSVRARGDLPPPMLPPAPEHCSDFEKNLLLPRGVPAERPWARLRVRLYRAEGLSALRQGLLGSLARALHDQRVLVEPYVRVSFLGQEGETSVRAQAAAPEWNEQLSFVELFPPLTRSLRLQLRDDAPLVDAALATHVLDLRRISHPGRAAGFNPTFGPAWVPLYGSPPGAGLRDGLQGLNEGVGQGIWFRGRLLLAVSMQVLEGRAEPEPPQAQQGSRLSRLTRKKKKKARRDQTPKGVPQHVDASPGAEVPEIPSAVEVEVEELLPLPENVLAPCEDFLLFGVLFEATMIDPAVASQPISFEISIGRAGRLEEQLGGGSRAGEGTEGASAEAQPLLGARPEEEKEEEELGTPAQWPEPMDGSGPYFCLPLRHRKPCVHVWSRWEDHTWRLQSSNCVHKVAERLDQGLQEVERLQRRPGPGACAQLKQALEELVAGSRQFCRGAERRTMTRPNALDRCRGKLLVHSLNLLAKQGLRLLRGLRRGNVQKKVALAKKLLAKLHFLAEEDLPEQPYLQPPLSILVIERRAFGRTVLVGSHIVPHMLRFIFRGHEDPPEEEGEMEETSDMMPKGPQGQKSLDPFLAEAGISRQLLKPPLKKLPLGGLLNQGPGLEEDIPDPEELDWWSKYYTSLQELQGQHNLDEDEMDDPGDSDGVNLISMVGEAQDQGEAEVKGTVSRKKAVATLKIYNRSLEEEFNHFEDWLYVFPLYRGQGGQDAGGEEEGSGRLVGKFKGSFLIYPESEAVSFSEPQISRGIPQNRPIKLLVRVYVVKATNLAPADPNGKADPYVVVSAGRERQDTKERYIPKQLNPIFGEILELSISLPAETELTVAIFDHDLVGSDDLIGETHIDLENRFYSHHRANCGLASQYDVDGYNAWRDAFRPSQILAGLCQRCGLPAPEYRAGAVKVGSKVFLTPPETLPPGSSGPKVSGDPEEAQALLVLRRWQEIPGFGIQLVPEHVETRPLYHPRSPGLLQGSLHMWIDIFPRDVPAPPPVDIKPRQPVSYELRVVIWNTEDVVLDDVNPLTGEMSSDIYVKSWVKGLEHDKQETDVHFNSLTGEGNFNWRFVFHFDYLPTEREVSVRRRPGPFALEEAEFRQPAVLVLQVWDYDRISANDFLGSLELQLPDMVRGARGPELCSVRLARDGAGPRCNLFRCRRLRGWWPVVKLKEAEDVEREAQASKKKRKQRRRKGRPEDLEFTDTGGNVYILTGKVEAEFELLTVEEAEKRPVGKGRKEPEPLEKPSRPKTSFNWLVNPLKTFVFFIWRRYWRILVLLLLLALLTVFLLLVFYTIPGQISQVIFRPLHK